MTGIELLRRPWAPQILLSLSRRPLRYNELLREVGVADNSLTPRLRELENAKLVSRQVEVVSPIRVTYGLTTAGRVFVAPLEHLASLGTEPEEVAI